jgi:putative membrane protein
MEYLDQNKAEKLRKIIIFLSVLIPLAVAALFGIKVEGTKAFRSFPSIYAVINGLTAICLTAAFIAIKKKNVALHFTWIRLALLLSLLFLVMYVMYHLTSPTTYYGDANGDGKVDILEKAQVRISAISYYVLLATHIVLSIVVVPLVLFAYMYARTGQLERHRRWVRYAFPIWLYVAISGVVVYILIYPYYR